MIHVEIYINDRVIVSASAVRIKGKPGQRCTYRTGRGHILSHDYDEGAVALAKRLLDDATREVTNQ